MSNALVIYDTYVNALEQCYRVDEVKEIRDKAIALEQYARQALNVDAERKAIEIRIRAERKAGQLLADTERSPKSKGGDTKSAMQREGPKSEYQEAKEDAGISDTQAQRWQQLAAMPHEDFERKLQDPLIKPTTTGLINGDKPKPASDRALWLWGQLRDFEEKGVLNDDINKILNEMSEALQSDVKRIVPRIIDWLRGLD